MNRGKQFEGIIRDCIQEVPDVSIDRLKDTTSKQKGNCNPSDFVVYKKPNLYYIECKSIQKTSLPFSNIRQWDQLVSKSKIDGVYAGVIIWFVEHDSTIWVDIQLLQELKKRGYKSINYFCSFAAEDIQGIDQQWTYIKGQKKRITYHYDMGDFFNFMEDKK